MIDRTTKILLAVIAAGLWAHVAVWQLRPAIAQDYVYDLHSIEIDVSRIASGMCSNKKIC